MFKRFAIACFVLCAFVLPARAAVGEKAPPLAGKALDGSSVDLAKLEGKAVIVYLWNTQCAACVKDLQTLRDFYHQYEDRGLAVVALAEDPLKLKYAVQEAEGAVDYPVVMAAEAKRNGFAAPEKFPLVYIMAKDGTVRGIYPALPAGDALPKAVFR
ncbi:MAG: TlpA family protein disulfide reductase [Alphaproteobacteria bacterium]|nr:TlpA family protein disulfide reductase [Alphaproteobacteria bacterium]